MAGLYLHIPFCRKACHYCDFHFSTNQKLRKPLLEAMVKEIRERSKELSGPVLDSVYFGGGTPSILEEEELRLLFDAISGSFELRPGAEITLEANPDDLTAERLVVLAQSPVNRLSIGIQSFQDEVLVLMNRAHNAAQALAAASLARESGFEHFSIDLIYGVPGVSEDRWQEDVERAISLFPDHLSAYCLTIEEGTAFHHFIEKGKMPAPRDEAARAQYLILCDLMAKAGYRHYEVSNFALPGKEAAHNSAYWSGEEYLGIGPSAHSFVGGWRSWNVSSNARYISGMDSGTLLRESEQIDAQTRYNEILLTGLRTSRGVDLEALSALIGQDVQTRYARLIGDWESRGLVSLVGSHLLPTEEGFLWADALAMEMMEG